MRTTFSSTLFIALASASLAWLLDAFVLPPKTAFCVSTLIAEVFALVALLRKGRQPRSVIAFVACLLVADLATVIRTHLLQISYLNSWTVLTAYLPYTACYFVGAYALFRAIPAARTSGDYLRFTVPSLITISLASFFLFPSLLSLIASRGLDLFCVVRLINSFASMALLLLSLTVFFRAPTPFLNAFSLCAAILILVNFCLGTELYLGAPMVVGMYHYAWLFGVLVLSFASIAFASETESQKLDDYRLSLAAELRAGILVIGFCVIALLARAYLTPLPFVRVTFVSLVVATIVAVVVADLLARKVSLYSRLSTEAVERAYLDSDPNLLQQLPFEIQESLGSTLRGRLRQLRERIETRQQLEESAVKMLHDIKSPLAALAVAIDPLAEVSPGASALASRALQRAQSIADAFQTELIEPEHSKIPERSPIALGPWVRTLVAEKNSEHGHRVRIRFECDESNAQRMLNADPTELGRALSNLINNAAQACSEGGEVRVRVSFENPWHQIRIADDGCGIPPELLTHLGTRGLTSGKVGGSGLGIFQAKAAIEGHGGTLDFVSSVGVGTQVSIQLPVA